MRDLQIGGIALAFTNDAAFPSLVGLGTARAGNAGSCRDRTKEVLQALQRCGLGDVPVAPLVSVPPGTRRRAVLAAVQSGGGVHLGFHAARSHAVVDMTQCLILHPRLMVLLAPLRAVFETLLDEGERAAVTLTLSDSGPDILVCTPRAPGLAG